MSELRTTLVKQGATMGANATIACGSTIWEYVLKSHVLSIIEPGRLLLKTV